MYAGRRFWSGPFPAEAVRALTGLLLDEEPRIRQEAARALVAYDYPMAVSLQSLVKDESSDLVPEALEPLLASLGSEQHKEECEKCAAADLLGRVDDSRAADALLAALDDGPRIAQAALQSLARRPSARMVAPVEAAIRRFRGYPYVLREAIRLLAEIDDPSVVPILFDALKHRDLDLKRIALAGLSKWKEVSDPKQLPLVIRQLRYEKLEADAAAIITRIGEPAVAPLAAASNSGNRRAILSILARIGGAPAIDALISGFSVDRDLFEALERLGEPARVRVLELLGSRDKKQRRNALGILTLMREPRAVEALVAMGRGGSTSHDLIKALHLIGAPAVEPLLALLESKSSRARRFAMRALAGLDDARLLHPFLRAATDPESSVRSLAISGLSKWRDPRVFDVLIASLDDEWEEVERQAVKAIGDVRDPRVPPYLVARLGAGSQDVVEALIKHGKAAVPALLEGLGSKVPGIRVGCVRVLGKIGGPSAVEALASALADPATRRTASERLEGLGWRPGTAKERVLSLVGRGTWKEIPRIGAEAIAPLTRLLEDTDAKVRGGAAASLGSIGEKATASRLVRTLKDPAPRVREAAARALSDLEWVPATASERADLLLAREDLPSLLELGRVGVDRLVAALDSESSRFRRLVTRALRDAAWSPADDIERLRYMIAAGEARKIAMLGEAALRPLTSLLRSGRPAHVRVAAAKHLAALGGPRAVRALVQALDGPIEVALEAAKALGSSKNPVAVAATVKLLTRADPRLGGLARRSLPRTGTPAIPPLIELLKDTRTRVRVDAARILRRITRQQSLGVDHAKWAAWWDRQPRR
ncbi:MAG: HEAT repeat domain-containing protein [Planctomycetota bacterium]